MKCRRCHAEHPGREMAEYETIPVSDGLANNARDNGALYWRMFQKSVINPEDFWRWQGEFRDWV